MSTCSRPSAVALGARASTATLLMLVSVSHLRVGHASSKADVAELNRVTFSRNVFAGEESEGPERWVVLFCADWFPVCEGFKEKHLSLAGEHGRASEQDLFSRKTRFAEVDCAVDKVLCNSQDVETYPTVVHYHQGGRAGEWSFSGKALDKEIGSFTKWLKKELAKEPEAPDAETGAPRPESHQHPASLSQLLQMVAALAAAVVWLSSSGAELFQGIQALRASGRREANDGEGPEKPPIAPQEIASATVRSVPGSWAERAGLEL